ncbi:MAG: hypothetical protein IK024_01015 [Treponema sp.]|nr:hypothetical protein [Treponema sp.]
MTSCENFLKATQVKEEIEEAIEIANSSPILYHIIADKDSGTVSPSQATLKKKQSVNLLFTPADGWSFICWEALDRNTNEPVPDAIQFENPQKLETKAIIIKPTENLMIHPKCQLVPKVIEITPKFDNSGCDQDRTIEVVFNKPVNPQTLDFTGISITTPEGAELFPTDPAKSFFETPYFSNDNKVLNIPTIKGKFLLLPDNLDENTTVYNSKKSTDDITVRLDLSAVKDTDGLTFEQPDPHTYRVNKTVDNVPPVITNIQLFSTSDTSALYYKELTTRCFSKNEWTNSDYHTNYVSKLFIQVSGYDVHSGLKAVRVKETYLYNTEGVKATEESCETDIMLSDTRVSVNDDVISLPYDFVLVNEGIISVEVKLVDKANKESEPRSYEVLRRNTSSIVSQFDNRTRDSEDYSQYFSKMIPFYFFQVKASSYFNNNNSYYPKAKIDIIVKNGEQCFDLYREQNLYNYTSSNIVTRDDIASSVNTRIKELVINPSNPIIIITSITDEGGVEYYYEDEMPQTPVIIPINMPDVYTNCSRLIVRKKKPSEDKFGPWQLFYSEQFTELIKVTGVFQVYGVTQTSVRTSFGSLTFHTTISDTPVTLYNDVQPDNAIISVPDLRISTNNPIKYPKNTGKAKVTVDVDFPNDGYNYFIMAKTGTNWIFSFREKTFEIPSGYNSTLWVEARDNEGNIVGATEENKKLNLPLYSEDNHAPDVGNCGDASQSRAHILNDTIKELLYAPNYCSCSLDISDRTVNSENETSSSLRIHPEYIKYWIVPYSSGTQLTLEDLKNYPEYRSLKTYSKTIEKTEVDIPIFGYDEKAFRCYICLEDNSENYSLWSFNFKHYVLDLVPQTGFNTDKFFVSVPNHSSSGYKAYVTYQYFEPTTGKWVDCSSSSQMEYNSSIDKENYVSYSYMLNDFSDKYVRLYCYYEYDGNVASYQYKINYTHPAYIFANKDVVCRNKGVLELINGFQVYCDNPTLVHTMFCPKKLTQTNTEEDASVWETHGAETGIVVENSNFSYTDANLDEIPKDYYYATIFHFADGTVVMSEVKQKQ